ncbi:hypothetical protein PS15m_004880 [Mucor circinelloides]
MDYPLHQSQYTDSTNHSGHHQQHQQQDESSNVTNSTANYRTYSMYNERSDISSIMFDGNSPNNEEDDSRSSMMLLSTRPPHSIHDPWNQPQLHRQQQQHHHHSPLLNNDYRQHQPIQHHQVQQQLSHSERGIAGFVSKLYQCLQSVDSNQKYARWCQHDGKDMFIIDCIPEFTEFVLPRLFKHCKFPSFVRQLNIYGFQRDTDARKSKDTKDKESCRWYHPCFRPGRRDLFHLIRRKATRYSRKRKVKTSNDEDPETILNLGSADESEIDEESQENMILLVNNNDEQDGRRSSSVSSVTQSMQHIDYNPTSSQLQLGFSEPATVATTTTATATSTNSPRIVNHTAVPLVVDTNINITTSNGYHSMATPTLAHNNNHNTNTILQEDLSSDNADDRIIDNGLVVNMQQQHHHHHFELPQQQLHQPLMRDQELRMQLYHMKQQYEKMHAYFKEQLSTAQIQIDGQQIRIQQLEGALGITKHSVKQGTIQQPATGGYMSTVCTTIPNSSSPSAFNNPGSYNLQQQQRQLNQNSPIITPRLVTSNHRPMYQMSQQSSGNNTIAATPRPNYYYHENATSPSAVSGNTNNNNNIDNKSKMIAQMKNEIISSPSTPSTSSNAWLPYHRDSLSTTVMIDPANNVTAGSSKNPSTTTTGTGTDTKLKSALPTSNSSSNTSLIMHSNVHNTNNTDNNDNHDTNNIHNNNKIDLMGHMHFNSFI